MRLKFDFESENDIQWGNSTREGLMAMRGSKCAANVLKANGDSVKIFVFALYIFIYWSIHTFI